MNDNRSATARRIPVHRAVVLLPVALASAAWTVSVAGAGGVPVAAEPRPAPAPAAVADPVAVPDRAVEPPASVALPRTPRGVLPIISPVAAAAPIPATALAAYQRAAVVIGSADEDCHLAWPLVAAIGKVESDHGRTGGSVLGADGVAHPSIVGLRLDGSRGTARISDTDAGRYDGDPAFDRAVGPMQFIPTTWGVVGVDADDDGVRNPQDVDDAALATAVYLCSGEGDLSTPAGQRQAVLRYNHSQRYADLVLSVTRSYAAASLSPLAAAGFGVPSGGLTAVPPEGRPATAHAARQPVRQARPEPAPPKPAAPKPSPQPAPTPAQPEPAAPVRQLLTRTQAVLACTVRGLTQLLQPTRFQNCVEELMNK